MGRKPGPKSESNVWKILIPIAVALAAGGSAPWWWQVVYPPPYMGELLWNTNLQGKDVSNLDKPELNTAGECSSACQKDERCKSMTFVKHPSSAGGICWPKNIVPDPGLTLGLEMVSAVKVYPGIFGTK